MIKPRPTADWLEAEDALRLGVLNRLVPSADLQEETMALATRIAGKSPVANRLVKGMVYRGLGQSLEEHLPEAAHAEVLSLASEDHREALAAFLEGREGNFKGK